MYGDGIVFESDYNRGVSAEKRARDLAKLAEFQTEAEAINEAVFERRVKLATALQVFAETELRDYQYDPIEQVVQRIIGTGDLQHWDLGESRCWLPSNFGC